MASANRLRAGVEPSTSAPVSELQRLTFALSEMELRMEERTRELANSVALLEATFESSADGISASRLSGEIICLNRKCAEIWRLPADFDELGSEGQTAHVLSQLKNPEENAGWAAKVTANSEVDFFSVIEMKDERVLEAHWRPLLVDGQCAGRVGIYRDVTERRRAHAEIERIHAELLEASRLAGKAEIATNVLHNVGNVLNSVNVSATLVRESITRSKISGVGKAVALLREHEQDLGAYLGNDPQGKLLPSYLEQLSGQLEADRAATLNELKSLTENIEHIKEILATQQAHAVASNTSEIVDIANLLEEALRLNVETLARHGIEVVREIAELPSIRLDKHRALQILVNLLGNAKQACREAARDGKSITLAATRKADRIVISVKDNGVGIPAENLTRIFHHGFTTRVDGHGFGLHSAALTARQMGGSLRAESCGPGLGATFILELPIAPLESPS